MKKILICFGTRPEAIKMLPVYLEFLKDPSFEVKLCVTGQHREMLDQVLEIFEVVPDYDLNIMKKGQTLSEVTSKIIRRMDDIIEGFMPDMIFVHGDTATTLSVSIAAFYNKISIAHVEAGLRTFNLKSPWPEEANRKLTSVITDLHFAPTDKAKNNLIDEGYAPASVYVTGNTVIDALMMVRDNLSNSTEFKESLIKRFDFLDFSKKFVLVTGHRRENFGEGFKNICTVLNSLALDFPEVNFVYPVHLNPNVSEVVKATLGDVGNIYLIEPLDYQSFVFMMDQSYFILTDSGGVQEEAPSLNKPVLVMRDTTERPEGLKSGTLKLVGTSVNPLIKQCHELLTNQDAYNEMSNATNPYGDGMASGRILRVVKEYFSI